MIGRGGVRKGAGRPKTDPRFKKVQINNRIPQWIVDWLKEHDEPQSQLIEVALIEKHDLKPPEIELDDEKPDPQ